MVSSVKDTTDVPRPQRRVERFLNRDRRRPFPVDDASNLALPFCVAVETDEDVRSGVVGVSKIERFLLPLLLARVAREHPRDDGVEEVSMDEVGVDGPIPSSRAR